MRMLLVLLVLHSGCLIVSFNQLPGDTDISCTDDSDCIPLGHKFGCFLYRCKFIRQLWSLKYKQPLTPDASTMLTPPYRAVNSLALALSVTKVGIDIKIYQKREKL